MKRRDEVSVGILITIAVAVLMVGVLWLARGGLSSGYPLYTRFSWGQNLKQGQPVLLAGVNIGYVDDVQLQPDGYLDVVMRINNRYKVPKSVKATVRAVGFFGDVAVALTPRLGGDLTTVFAPGDSVPAGPREPGVAEIMSKADSVSEALNQITHALQTEVVNAGGLNDLRKTIATTAALATQMQQIAAEQNVHLTKTLAAYQRVAESIDSSVVDSTMRNLRASSRSVSDAATTLRAGATQLNDILSKLNSGQGTAGLLLTDSTLYRNLRNTTASLDSLLADIKAHPGRYVNVHIF
ncbi:MAG: MCE family protein [Gemmatimonadota bacterium]|nr:MCE family protein [Gemmatimonadota bacterium]HEU4990548.1 MlaD family protein [Gemmatimonadaceae bacterium]